MLLSKYVVDAESVTSNKAKGYNISIEILNKFGKMLLNANKQNKIKCYY
jgi:hypothetical protein